MQVSQIEESDNILVMGGAKSKAFEISNSAHAFKILSDSLYSDKKLAVVREYLCNAADAHIAAGYPDRPFEVTIGNGSLIVKDYGLGIADAKMAEIYCTYFASTKTDDDNQTGGFGLGCKAAFAYTDHFMVTSCHKGVQSTYAILLHDEDADGAPGCKRMAATKTEETGITVTIPINPSDQDLFEALVRTVVRGGGMKAKLNGSEIRGPDYADLKKFGYGYFGSNGTSPVKVLYGNVLYPVTQFDGITRYNLGLFYSPYIHHGRTLILYARPSSVTVTPSREALSYSPKTVKTLNALMAKVHSEYRRAERRVWRQEIDAALPKTTRGLAYYNVKNAIRNKFADAVDMNIGSCGAEAMAARDIKQRFDETEFERFLKRRIQRFFHDHRVSPKMDEKEDQAQYFRRRILRVVTPVTDRPITVRVTGSYYGSSFTPLRKSKITRFRETPTIYAASSRDLMFKNGSEGYWICKPNWTVEELTKLAERAARFGFEFCAMSAVKAPKKPKVEKAPKVAPDDLLDNLPAFKLGLPTNKYNSPNRYQMIDKKAAAVKSPSAFIALPINRKAMGNGDAIKTTEWIEAIAKWCSQHMPNVVIAENKTIRNALVKAGVPSLESVLVRRIKTYDAKNPGRISLMDRIVNEESHSTNQVGYFAHSLMQTGLKGAYAAFGLAYEAAPEDQAIFSLIKAVGEIRYASYPARDAGQVSGWPDDTHTTALGDLAKFVRNILAEKVELTASNVGSVLLERMTQVKKKGWKAMPHLNFFHNICEWNVFSNVKGESKDRLIAMIVDEATKLYGKPPKSNRRKKASAT